MAKGAVFYLGDDTNKWRGFCMKYQLTLQAESGKILLIHYGSLYLCVVPKYLLGGNQIEGLGIYHIHRRDGSCYKSAAGDRQ
jgi:hypothetical protein